MTAADPLLYTIAQAAERLAVTPRWLGEQVRTTAVPHRRLGRLVRFSDDDLRAIVAAARQQTARETARSLRPVRRAGAA